MAPDGRINENWLEGPVATWYGVTVNEDRVVELNLSGDWNNTFGLTGSIPVEIGNLTALEVLNLSYNDLIGNIPPEIGNLNNLRELFFTKCQFSGIIPEELGDLINLEYLSLYMNNLSGEIPPSLGNLMQLRTLELTYNNFTGTIPIEIYEITNLESLILGGNLLEGNIHPNIGHLINLRVLGLYSNNLTGEIPHEIGNLTNLSSINLGWNNLNGNLPDEIALLSKLNYLNFSDNKLEGTIPAVLFEHLNSIIISFNNFDNLSEINNCPNLYELEINNNNFTFEDLEYNMDIPMVQSPWGDGPWYNYNPQNRIGIPDTINIQTGDTYNLNVTCGGTQNSYQWFKDNVAIGAPSSNSDLIIENADFTDAGTYYCQVTNSLVPDLVIQSSPVKILRERINLVITEALRVGVDNTYAEITNMGDKPVDLNEVKWGKINPWRTSIYDVYNDSWNPGLDWFYLPEIILQPGESFVITTAYDFGPAQYNKKVPGYTAARYKQPELYELADLLIHIHENNGDETDSITRYISPKGGGDFEEAFTNWRGRSAWYLEQQLSETDFVVIDQVGGVFDNNGQNQDIQYDVAGVQGAVANSVLVRKFSVKQGNLDFANARGVGSGRFGMDSGSICSKQLERCFLDGGKSRGL